MKKIVILLLMLSFVLGVPAHAQESTDPAVLSGCHSIQAKVPLNGQQLLPTAKSVVLYELNSDTLIHGWNVDEPLDPSGMVKFMTVLVALEQGDLQAPVTVTKSALNTLAIGAVSVDLVAEEVLSLQDLLYCVMVASANDACAVIAEHISGSQEGFVELMNQKAVELGCKNTVFADPHGLAGSGQTSTARELALIVEAALEDPIFAEMFCVKEYTVAATNKSERRELVTTNRMMSTVGGSNYYDERVTGGKPAAVSLKDRSMICTAEEGGSRFLCVVMSAQSELTADESTVISFNNFKETIALLDYGFANFTVQQVIDVDQILCQYGVSGGENDVVMHPSQNVMAVLPLEMDADMLKISERVDPSKLVAPIRAGDVLGTVHISYGTVVLGSCELLAVQDVAGQGTTIRPAAPAQEEAHPLSVVWKILGWSLVILLVVAVLFFLGLVILRAARVSKLRATRRRRRKERRRSR